MGRGKGRGKSRFNQYLSRQQSYHSATTKEAKRRASFAEAFKAKDKSMIAEAIEGYLEENLPEVAKNNLKASWRGTSASYTKSWSVFCSMIFEEDQVNVTSQFGYEKDEKGKTASRLVSTNIKYADPDLFNHLVRSIMKVYNYVE